MQMLGMIADNVKIIEEAVVGRCPTTRYSLDKRLEGIAGVVAA